MRYDKDELAKHWREHAATLRKYGADHQAAVLEQCASEIESERQRCETGTISLDEAVELTGFSRSHLRRLWRTGKVRQLGTQRNPEFNAADLPKKTGYNAENKTLAGSNTEPVNLRMQVARAVVRGD
ncbi:MAG: hypothetical protein JWM27_3085 [Gemmatimonadetes bacterium]|nr:hypothetical protein [Gemmatimonadota bacterium]